MKDARTRWKRSWKWIGLPLFLMAMALSLALGEWQRAMAWGVAILGWHGWYGSLHMIDKMANDMQEVQDKAFGTIQKMLALTPEEWGVYSAMAKRALEKAEIGGTHGEQDEDEVLH